MTEMFAVAQGEDFDPATVAWVLDEDSLSFLLAAIEMAEEVIFDKETTGLVEHAVAGGIPNEGYPARVVLIALTLPSRNDPNPLQPGTWVVPLSHPDSPWLGRWREILTRILKTILDNRKPIDNQNMKFDCRWGYAMTGLDLSGLIVWDPEVGSHLIDENESRKLGNVVPRMFGVRTWKSFDFRRPGEAERVNLIDLGIYGAQDTYWVFRLSRLQRELLNLLDPLEPESAEDVEAARLGKLATWVVMPTLRTLTAVEQRGMLLDVEWARSELSGHQKEAQRLGDKLAGRYPREELEGDWSFAPTSNWFKAFTEIAVENGDLRVAAFTDGGKPQWSKGVLLRQERSGSEVAGDILAYRGHAKKAEFLTSWLSLVTPAGKIHTSYNLGKVSTGRLSSSGPNMQQVTGALKPAFPAPAGYVRVEFDYSQIEMRVAAFISRSPSMMRAFREGLDLHRMLAAQVTGKSLDDITAAERQAGKAGNFGLLFMMNAYGFQKYAEDAYDVSFTMEESEAMYQGFYDLWEGIADWHAKAIARVKATGQITSPLGRVRRLPGIFDGYEKHRKEAERQAVNSPVQGMASDICMIAASLIEGQIPGSTRVQGADLVGTVHDSLIADLEEDRWEEIAHQIIHVMTIEVLKVLRYLGVEFDVPLKVEASVGTRWGLKDIGVIEE